MKTIINKAVAFALAFILAFALFAISTVDVSASTDRVYLESDIMAFAQTGSIRRHPLDGSFLMGGVAYFEGLSTHPSKSWNAVVSATYNIAGRGFTRIVGTFGRVGSDMPEGILTITADGVLIGGFEVGTAPREISAAIPYDTGQIIIRLQRRDGQGSIALGNAFFDTGIPPALRTPPRDSAHAVYLESDIMAFAQTGSIIRHPLDGSFLMGGVAYFEGLSTHPSVGWHLVASATYNIAGRGFTQLTGTFGRVGNDIPGGTLTIVGDGATLGAFEITTVPRQVNVQIPAGTAQVVIQMQRSDGQGSIAFGDAFFSGGALQIQPTPSSPPEITGITMFGNGAQTISIESGDTVTAQVNIVSNTSQVDARLYVGTANDPTAWFVGPLTFAPGVTSMTSVPFSITNNPGTTYTRLYVVATNVVNGITAMVTEELLITVGSIAADPIVPDPNPIPTWGDVTVTEIGVFLEFNISAGNRYGYRIFRAPSAAASGISISDFAIIPRPGDNRIVTFDSNVRPETIYYYYIREVIEEARFDQATVTLSPEVLGQSSARFRVVTPSDIVIIPPGSGFIMMWIDDPVMNANDEWREIDPGFGTAPIIRYGRTMLPIRAVVETITGYEDSVAWDGTESRVDLYAFGNEVSMWIGRLYATVNGAVVEMDVAPFVDGGRTFLPVRFVAEFLGIEIAWIASERMVVIVYDMDF